jgi:hypothetical protein
MGDTAMGTVYYNHGTCKMKQTGYSKCTKSVDVTPPATKLSCTDAAYGWAGMKVPSNSHTHVTCFAMMVKRGTNRRWDDGELESTQAISMSQPLEV